MPSFKLIVEYDGSRYNGFQRQVATSETFERPPKRPHFDENGRKKRVPCTVQGCLEDALVMWTETTVKELRLRFAGRTDKGVHATGQVVAFDLPQAFDTLDGWELCKNTNSRLPEDISVTSCEPCDKTFEPRHGAKLKTYTYHLRYRRKAMVNNELLPICNSGPHTLRSAHDGPCLWVCPWPLDDSHLNELCQHLTGTHDYSCFVHKDERHKRDNTMELLNFNVEITSVSDHDAPVVNVKFTLQSQGFRRTMVRNLVGFVVDICRGKVARADVSNVWTATDDVAAMVNAAPASGLCLARVSY